MRTHIKRAALSDEVRRFVALNEDLNESFAVLETATEYGPQHAEPMTLEAALRTIHEVASQIEALDPSPPTPLPKGEGESSA